MKTKAFTFILAMLVCAASGLSQKDPVDKLFDKYSEK